MSRAAYAVVVEIVIEPASDPVHRHRVLNEFVVPELQAIPGYVKSLWLNSGSGSGTCIVVFDDAADARVGLEVLTRDGGPRVVKSGIHEVEVEDPPER